MLNLKPIRRSGTLKDRAYAELKNLFRSGRLSHDAVISANQFARELAVSRTPVREALLQLESEGILVALDGRGFKIRQFTKKEVQDLLEARRLIEAHCVARLAEDRARDASAWQGAIERMVRCESKADAAGFMAADEDFHMQMLRQCGNQLLVSMIDNIRYCISLLGHRAISVPGRMSAVIAEHRGIATAVERGDAKAAVAAMADHLRSTEEHLLALCDGAGGKLAVQSPDANA